MFRFRGRALGLTAVLVMSCGFPPPGPAETRLSGLPLRELYSGALGQFMPNPGLAAEAQMLTELAYCRAGDRITLDLSPFAARLDGAIERIVVDDEAGTFRRVNLDALRSLGVEGELALNAGAGVRVSAHWLQLVARRSADATDAVDGLRPLPAQARLALLAAWWRYLGNGALEAVELRLRLGA